MPQMDVQPVKKRKLQITKKQESFAQAILAGKSRLEAYVECYDKAGSGLSQASLYSMSYRVATSEVVKARIAELRAQSSESLLWSREMAIRKLTEILEAEDSSRDIQLKAIKELNGMMGYEAPRKNAAQGQRIAVMGDLIIDTGIKRDGMTIEGQSQAIEPPQSDQALPVKPGE